MPEYDIVVLFENLNAENEHEVLELIRPCLDADYGDNVKSGKVMVVEKGGE